MVRGLLLSLPTVVSVVIYFKVVVAFQLPRRTQHYFNINCDRSVPVYSSNDDSAAAEIEPLEPTTPKLDEEPNDTAATQTNFSPTTSTAPSTRDTTHSSAPGAWEELHGNYILRPSAAQQPRALIHFLGGAFVGAAPDISYRYVLERLSAQGFLIVATPYQLSFDYLMTCDTILGKFEKIAPMLARQYGAVPVVGVGHSCGALLHLLITSLFPDTPRAANALISYNNKSVNDAVPLFEELIQPLFQVLVGDDGNSTTGSKTVVDSLQLALDMARMTADGDLPTDAQLQDFYTALIPQPLQEQANTLISTLVTIPGPVRDVLSNLLTQTKTVVTENQSDALPVFQQSIDILDQVPSLIREVAVEGVTDFTPSRASIRQAARRAYRARRTLLLQYKDDGIDESPDVEKLLKEAETVMRMKRPMVNNMDLRREVLEGNHATPVLAPPLDTASKIEDVLGEDLAKESLLYKQADDTVQALVKWLEEGQL